MPHDGSNSCGRNRLPGMVSRWSVRWCYGNVPCTFPSMGSAEDIAPRANHNSWMHGWLPPWCVQSAVAYVCVGFSSARPSSAWISSPKSPPMDNVTCQVKLVCGYFWFSTQQQVSQVKTFILYHISRSSMIRSNSVTVVVLELVGKSTIPFQRHLTIMTAMTIMMNINSSSLQAEFRWGTGYG